MILNILADLLMICAWLAIPGAFLVLGELIRRNR